MSFPIPQEARFLLVWPCNCGGEGCGDCHGVGRHEAGVGRDALLDWLFNNLAARMLDTDSEATQEAA